MLENSTFPVNPSSPTTDRSAEEVAGDGGSVSVGLEEEERAGLEQGYRNWAGNRWPRPETLALLKIRSDMDAEFKAASPKLPLWEEVSRKMGEAGYSRDAKKCKEKFENIYKYHKRTRESRGARSAGKTYKYFEQLEAIEQHHSEHPPPAETVQASTAETAAASPKDGVSNAIPCSSMQHQLSSFVDNSTPTTSCSSKESEGTHKKKRRVTEFFEKLMKQVIDKQENLQTKFVEVLDKYEQERIAREEAWKMQELTRIERERELLAQERSVAAAKDAAVLAFLQKFSEQAASVNLPSQSCSVQIPNQPSSVHLPLQACSVQLPNQVSSAQLPVQASAVRVQMPANSSVANTVSEKQKKDEDWELVRRSLESPDKNNGRSRTPTNSTRWPREEVSDLIRLRSNYDLQYQENGSKGHLWEEIAASMKKLGYDRNAKRCKEKWENINKYYRRLKDSNKKRPEDSKTCAYVEMLDSLYNKKNSKGENQADKNYDLRPEELLMHMMSGQEEQQQQPESATQNGDSQNVEKIQGDNGSIEGVGDVAGDGYRIVAANPSPMEQDNPSVAIMS
ncbi:PREDICTED: trihelix transcription factor GT-2-like [Fragaria vesca subsp. vesca]|uniref:Trihelix transcription factor GT-2E n=1 Tax=Fragaria ananassa TaxID=3747 RepID=A0A2H4NFW3_FRAAN|nr:PREDICTED: trihelix transcription factor GT-2-like [Fragaria vesca subsp. vesca]ATV90832.1 trihelix transcription factor GT-2E [Fragaria x ananassa]